MAKASKTISGRLSDKLFCWTHCTFHPEGELKTDCVAYRGGKLEPEDDDAPLSPPLNAASVAALNSLINMRADESQFLRDYEDEEMSDQCGHPLWNGYCPICADEHIRLELAAKARNCYGTVQITEVG